MNEEIEQEECGWVYVSRADASIEEQCSRREEGVHCGCWWEGGMCHGCRAVDSANGDKEPKAASKAVVLQRLLDFAFDVDAPLTAKEARAELEADGVDVDAVVSRVLAHVAAKNRGDD